MFGRRLAVACASPRASSHAPRAQAAARRRSERGQRGSGGVTARQRGGVVARRRAQRSNTWVAARRRGGARRTPTRGCGAPARGGCVLECHGWARLGTAGRMAGRMAGRARARTFSASPSLSHSSSNASSCMSLSSSPTLGGSAVGAALDVVPADDWCSVRVRVWRGIVRVARPPAASWAKNSRAPALSWARGSWPPDASSCRLRASTKHRRRHHSH